MARTPRANPSRCRAAFRYGILAPTPGRVSSTGMYVTGNACFLNCERALGPSVRNASAESAKDFVGRRAAMFISRPSLGAAAGAEVVVLVVNSAKYGGCANTGTFVVALPLTAPVDVVRERSLVAVHELGHALFNLGDEYGGATCEPSRVSTGRPNTGTWGAAIWRFPAIFILPWKQMIPPGTPIPTPVQGAAPRSIGAFEGAEYCDTLRYRPSPVCGMRSIDHTYCPVCQVEVARVFATRYPVMPSCLSFCDYGQCGECDEGGYVTSCYIHNGCGGMYNIP